MSRLPPIAEPSLPHRRAVTISPYGKLPDGTPVDSYTLTNAHGCSCKIITYGACMTELRLPDKFGKFSDVILGYENLADYLEADGYFGATIGRVTNRIADAQFMLDGKTYRLNANDGKNHLHGGLQGFDKVNWQKSGTDSSPSARVLLTHFSLDGHEGYPGNLSASVAYTFTDSNELSIEYTATTDQSTPVNFTNHAYFNLAGHGDILDHRLKINADLYTPLDDHHLPLGNIISVEGTVADFGSSVRIGARLAAASGYPYGFNFNYALNQRDHDFICAAQLHEPQSGRVLEVWTDQPGLQFYTGGYIRPSPIGKQGQIYGPGSGLCLETQKFPDAVNQKNFPPTILHPGELYRHKTVWKFSTL